MFRVAPFVLCLLCVPALAANIDFGGIALDQHSHEAFSRFTAMQCFAQAATSTCSGEIAIEGVKSNSVAIWRKARGGELVLAQATADLACDTATIRRVTEAWTTRWGKPRARALESGKSLWSWQDAAGNRASFSNVPDATRAACTLLVEGGRWARQ